jgi:plasmid stability protein
MKKRIIFCLASLMMVSVVTLSAQTASETLIMEKAQVESRESKKQALSYAKDAIDKGVTSDGLRAVLEFLVLERTHNKTTSGQAQPNYSDVRRDAATYLGKFASAQTKTILLKVLRGENEPLVLTAAVRSLTEIGINEGAETEVAIANAVIRFDLTQQPDNFLAMAALDAFETFSKANSGVLNHVSISAIIRIFENGLYAPPVRRRAEQLLTQLSHQFNE